MLIILHLSALFLLVLLGFYVFVADPRSRAHQTFAAFIAFLALWTTKDLIFWNFADVAGSADWWVAASFVIALLMQFVFAVFAWVFPEGGRTPRRKAAILFSPGAILIPAAIFGYLWKQISFQNGRFDIELTIPAYVLVAYVNFIFVYGTLNLVNKYKLYKGTLRGKQVGAIIWGLVVTGVLIGISNLFLPFFDNYSLLPYSSALFLPGVFIYAYAISKFRLFSLQTALDQFRLFPLTYKVALSIAAVAITSFLVLQIPIVWWAFQNGPTHEAWKRYLVFSVVTALIPNLLLLLLVVRTISRPLQRITIAAISVSEGNYDTRVNMRKSNDEIGLLAASFNEMSRKMADDIVKLRNMNEQMRLADRLAAMGSLAAGVAHKMNDPLTSVSGMIQMIRSGRLSQGEINEKLETVLRQLERISGITKDLTDFARVRPASRSEVDIAELIGSSVRLANYDPEFKKIDVVVKTEPDLPTAYVDGSQLQQVLLNLFLNARDAMNDSGKLSINSFSKNGKIVIEVSDTGPGVEKDAIKKVFDPFFTTKSAGQGSGLGLAVCYGIVTSHEGTIDVNSNESGGATFVITLPQRR